MLKAITALKSFRESVSTHFQITTGSVEWSTCPVSSNHRDLKKNWIFLSLAFIEYRYHPLTRTGRMWWWFGTNLIVDFFSSQIECHFLLPRELKCNLVFYQRWGKMHDKSFWKSVAWGHVVMCFCSGDNPLSWFL